MELSIVMPCLNEAETVGICVGKALRAIQEAGIAGEVVVADNGSQDDSQKIAEKAGARVVHVDPKGYGSAIQGGVEAAQGEFIVVGDADDSYDFSQAPLFVAKLREGFDLVMGNRFSGGIQPGAMPFLHRYLGNPVLSFVGRLFFGNKECRDFHCGLRGFRKAAIEQLNLRTTGMEYATEMIVKSSLQGLRITEIPAVLRPDGRSGSPHLRSWHDGWRHLRFMLLYSPTWLFLIPGLALMLVGVILGGWLVAGRQVFHGIAFDVHTLLYCCVAVIMGYQAVMFHIFSKTFASIEGLLPPDPATRALLRYFRLETGIVLGGFFVAAGFAATAFAVNAWSAKSFGQLNPREVMRLVIPAATLIVLGCQTVFSSFFISILSLKRK